MTLKRKFISFHHHHNFVEISVVMMSLFNYEFSHCCSRRLFFCSIQFLFIHISFLYHFLPSFLALFHQFSCRLVAICTAVCEFSFEIHSTHFSAVCSFVYSYLSFTLYFFLSVEFITEELKTHCSLLLLLLHIHLEKYARVT